MVLRVQAFEWSADMYLRHTRGAAWIDPADDQLSVETRHETAGPRTLWARSPWNGRQGLYVALRLRAGELQVGIRRDARIEWRPAAQCLTGEDARRWARSFDAQFWGTYATRGVNRTDRLPDSLRLRSRNFLPSCFSGWQMPARAGICARGTDPAISDIAAECQSGGCPKISSK